MRATSIWQDIVFLIEEIRRWSSPYGHCIIWLWYGVLKTSLYSPTGGYLCYFKYVHSNYIFITIKLFIWRMLFWLYHGECENSENRVHRSMSADVEHRSWGFGNHSLSWDSSAALVDRTSFRQQIQNLWNSCKNIKLNCQEKMTYFWLPYLEYAKILLHLVVLS